MLEVERTFVIQREDEKVLELEVRVDRGCAWYIMKRDNKCDRSISVKRFNEILNSAREAGLDIYEYETEVF